MAKFVSQSNQSHYITLFPSIITFLETIQSNSIQINKYNKTNPSLSPSSYKHINHKSILELELKKIPLRSTIFRTQPTTSVLTVHWETIKYVYIKSTYTKECLIKYKPLVDSYNDSYTSNLIPYTLFQPPYSYCMVTTFLNLFSPLFFAVLQMAKHLKKSCLSPWQRKGKIK